MLKIHHVGVFVTSIDEFKKIFSNNFIIEKKTKKILDKVLKVKLQFIRFKGNNQLFEIVEPYGNDSPVQKILDQKKSVLNHIAFISSKFDRDIEKLLSEGFYPLTKKLDSKYFNSKIVFLMSPFNFIVEIIDNDKNRKIKKKR